MEKFFTHLMCIAALVSACTKVEITDLRKIDLSEKTVLTPDQELLKARLNETALLVTQIAADKEVQKEVFNFVNMRYEGNYRVKFSHLLKPEAIAKGDMPESFRTGSFRDQFLKAISDNLAKGSKEVTPQMADYLVENDIEIAWHYSQEWNEGETPAVTFNPLDNDSVNIGYIPWYDDQGVLMYDTVLIDDEYAFEHPVMIIDQHEALPVGDPNADKFLGEPVAVTPINPNGPHPDGTAKYNKIYIYQVRTFEGNFRGIFGGENKMYFRRAGSEVVLDPQKTCYTKVIIDRWAGRKEIWRTVNAVWDENWQEEEITQWMGVEAIRVDNNSSFKITGDISLKLEVAPSIGGDSEPVVKPSLTIKIFGFDLTIVYKNELWYNLDWGREQFFIDNWRDADRKGIKDGKCIHLAGSGHRSKGVYYTLDVEPYDQ